MMQNGVPTFNRNEVEHELLELGEIRNTNH